MLELITQFHPAGGGVPIDITLRIGAPTRGENAWSAQVEVIGFAQPVSRLIHGEDWAQAIEIAARLLPTFLEAEVHSAGGGTVTPSFYERSFSDETRPLGEPT